MTAGIVLPTYVGSASQWQLSDWDEIQETSDPAVAGVATIELEQVPPGELWLLEHSVSYCTSSTATTMRLYAGAPDPLRLRDGSDRGNFDVAEWPRGLLFREGSSIVAQWSGCSAGAVAAITLQVAIYRKS